MTIRPESRKISRSTSAGPFQSGSIDVNELSRPRTRSNPDWIPEIRPLMIELPALTSHPAAPTNAPVTALLIEPILDLTAPIIEAMPEMSPLITDLPADSSHAPAELTALTIAPLTVVIADRTLVTPAEMIDEANDAISLTPATTRAAVADNTPFTIAAFSWMMPRRIEGMARTNAAPRAAISCSPALISAGALATITPTRAGISVPV